MKIAIINITGGGISGGYKKYLKNMLPRMSRHHEIEAILCASPQNLAVLSWFEVMDNVTFVNCKPFNVFGNKDTGLHNQLEHFHPDVIFVPIERYFKHRNIPTVCMLQNMLPMVPIRHSSMFETIRNKVQKAIAQKAVEGSRRIIAISGFVSEFMQQEWQIPSHKIGIVYNGVNLPQDEELTIPATVSPEWTGNFVFTAGSIELFRGLEDILRAVHHLRQHGWAERVIIAGSARPAMMSYYRKLQRLVDQLGVRENICWAGMLNENEMAWCYRNARAYIMTSRVEACPNTALEAMSYGTIIISTNVPPMYEFFGEAAKYYTPGDFRGLSEKIIEALNQTTKERIDISEVVVARALTFSWQKTVESTVDELKLAIKL
jgi:glycosyltransferase involved in cell wall biosynthesis